MTGLDGDGSTHSNAAAGRPAGDESEILAAPADPWLTEASTSPIGDPATMRDFSVPPPPDTMPYTHPVFAVKSERRRRGKARPVLIATLIGCALLLALPLIIDRFRADDDTQRSTPTVIITEETTEETSAPAPSPAPSPASSSAAPTTTVVYEVTASGSGNTGSISYTDEDGEIIRRNGIPLPWRTTFPVGTQRHPLVLEAQRKSGGDNGPVTCTITVDGKEVTRTTAAGRYAYALC
ncbi:hypothetical protein Ait01nite_070590 [Actinoplanes italicus]|uniref:MmpS family membrane protein n=1 Tax=Actinoplanes italicus TaxID=113567 RepID=A0A2T0JUZ4_9ACTN|nr:MmpS family transport accessory protein [Actinoplanes italicus]PRX11458.1 MmpS family membrane protein [Actinoplanes italicus]GIE34014.1 hypothetical protein Ait01nite_070590 [Actinoplanes italicus]